MKDNQKLLTIAFCIYAVCMLFSMAAMSIGAVLLFLTIVICSGGPVPFLKNFKDELRKPFTKVFLFLSLALTSACLLSLIVAKINPLGYGGKYPEINFLKDMAKAWYLFWPFVLLVGLRRLLIPSRGVIFKTWIIAFTILSALGIFQYFTGWPRLVWIPGNITRYHSTLFLGHHLAVASIFIFPFFVVLDLLRQKGSEKFVGLPRYILTAAIGFALFTFFATYSRAFWIGLPIGILAWSLLIVARKWKVVMILLGIIAGITAWNIPQIQNRMVDPDGVGSRKFLWHVNEQLYHARPVTGTGWHHNLELAGYYLHHHYPDGVHFLGHAHNNLLEMLASTGIIGAVTWVLWALFVVIILFWVKPSPATGPPSFKNGWLAAWIVFHINGITQVNFWDSKVLHTMTFVVAWTLLFASESQRKENVQ